MKKLLFLFLCLTALLQANVQEFKNYVSNAATTLEGWCSREKALHFADLVLETKPKLCVEIGVFGGSSALPVAAALKYLNSGLLIAIDPWDKLECLRHFNPIDENDDLKWWSTTNLEEIYRFYLRMLKLHELEQYCTTFRMTSLQAASQIENIDILYIDGHHNEKMKLKDVELFLPKVNKGGFVWINDACKKKPQKAIQTLQESCEFIKSIDNGNCFLFKKI